MWRKQTQWIDGRKELGSFVGKKIQIILKDHRGRKIAKRRYWRIRKINKDSKLRGGTEYITLRIIEKVCTCLLTPEKIKERARRIYMSKN